MAVAVWVGPGTVYVTTFWPTLVELLADDDEEDGELDEDDELEDDELEVDEEEDEELDDVVVYRERSARNT